jgi:cyclopropane-fatty-acyl-phospholipid synthase
MNNHMLPTFPAKGYCFPSRASESLIELAFQSANLQGALTLQLAKRNVICGSGASVATIFPPTLTRFLFLFTRADYNIGSFYTKGYWDCRPDELYDALRVLSSARTSAFSKAFSFFCRANLVRDVLLYGIFPFLVRRKIAAHYDTNPEFMKLILGDELIYTCAFFDSITDSLESAQHRKIELVGERLALKPNDQVLELGCGWGTAASILSAKHGVSITALSISGEQINHARNRYGRDVNFIHSDYIKYEPDKKYDKVYSIGMLEHIGKFKHRQYFGAISSLLRTDGVALVHSIVRDSPGTTNAWIDKEVFPGAYIPSYSEILSAAEQSGLIVENIYTHGPSNYYNTLKRWHKNFLRNRSAARLILAREMPDAKTEEILRMWDFYLCVSQLSFEEPGGACRNIQITLRKR